MYILQIFILHLSTLRYRYWQFGFVVGSRGYILNFSHYQEAIQDSTEYHMLTIQKVALRTGNKELAAIGIPAAVGHCQEARRIVLERKVLIAECVSINACDTGAIALHKITALNHEILNDSVKAGTFVANGHTIWPIFSCTELSKVLSSAWHGVRK